MKINCSYSDLVNLTELKPNPKNANRHSPEQIERLAKIIDFQGQRSPIVVSRNSGFIVKGHGRLDAIKKLGWTQCAVDFQSYNTPEHEYADCIADNEIGRWAEFDWQAFKEDSFEIEDFDFDLFGIDSLKKESPKTPEEKYQIIIECKDALEQADFLEEFETRSLQCKAK